MDLAKVSEEIRLRLAKLDNRVEELETVEKNLKIEEERLYECSEARIVIQKSAQILQRGLEQYVSGIVSKCLKIVFEEDANEFEIKFVERRNSIECDMFFKDGEALHDPIDSSGFGEADVASFALSIVYWSLGETRNTKIFDEPFRNLDGVRLQRASGMAKYLADEFNLQLIVVTHEDSLINECDRHFKVTKTKKLSQVKQIK